MMVVLPMGRVFAHAVANSGIRDPTSDVSACTPRPMPKMNTGERRYCWENSPKQIQSMASKLM